MRIDRDRRLLSALLTFFPPKVLVSAARVAELIDRYAKKPGGKSGFTSKRPEFLPRFEKCFLRQIVGQMGVPLRHAHEEAAHGGLVVANEFAEGIGILLRKDASNQISVSQGQG